MSHHPRMSAIAGWALLALGGLAAVVFVGGELAPVPHPSLDVYLSNLPIVPTYLIAAFLYWRRPQHPVARRLLVFGASPMIALALGEVLSVLMLSIGPRDWYWLIAAANEVAELGGVAGGVALVAVFPDGFYQRRYETWVVSAVAAQVVLVPVLLLLSLPAVQYDAFMVWAKPVITSPIYTPALGWLGPATAAYFDSVFLWVLVGAGLLVLRYRRLPDEARLQVKWPLFGAIFFTATVILGTLNHFGFVPFWLSQGAWYLALPLLPLCIAVALLRYRLLDIDVVIRKSLVYGVLWLGILGVYLAIAWAFGLLAGKRLPIEVAILVTIAATIAFQPARRWLERLADRWVFGERLSGYQALQRLGATLETTLDVDELGPRLASTVRSSLHLRWVRVWTRRRGGDSILLEPIGWDGIEPAVSAEADAVVPLEHADDLVGVIECGPKIEGRLDQRDHDLLAALARQAALGLRNARLAADLTDQLELVQVQAHDLAESRVRIVQAQDAERRRIQRDLHDGVQQHLVTLAANLRRATLVRTMDLAQKVEELAGEAEDTVFALQDFSNGIYPSVLSDEGLPAALWTHAQRLPVRVELDVAPDVVGKRFGLEREAALYFVALEALVNAQKHASAERLRVRLRKQGRYLQLEVTDDGRGMPSSHPRGLGLTNMKDRVAVLGGSLEIESHLGQGTRVIARVAVGPGVRAREATPSGRSAQPTHAD